MRKHTLAVLAIAALMVPALCSAQQGAAWRDSTRRLESSMRALHDSLLQHDSTAIEVARAGDLAIAASANERANAIDALEQFTTARNRRFSGALPSAGGFRIVIHTAAWEDRSRPGTQEKGAIILSGIPDTGASVRTQRSSSSSGAAKQLLDAYGEMMIASVPDLSRWIESPPPLSLDETQRRDEAMYAFVTATAGTQRRCVGGDLTACRVAVNIRHAGGEGGAGRFSPFMRTDLLYFALDAGGAGAWNRLRDAADTGMEARLVAASGMPMDSLLARWRDGLLALRPTAATLPLRSTLIAITWSALLLLGALGASKWA